MNALHQWGLRFMQSPLAFVDTETTGFANTDEIWQVGIVQFNQGVEGEKYQFECLPTVDFHPRASIVTGQTRQGLIDQGVSNSYLDIHPMFANLLAGRVVIFYNANFDWRMILNTMRKHQAQPAIKPRSINCLMKSYSASYGEENRRWGGNTSISLIDAVQAQGIALNASATHNALYDANLTAQLYFKIMAGYEE